MQSYRPVSIFPNNSNPSTFSNPTYDSNQLFTPLRLPPYPNHYLYNTKASQIHPQIRPEQPRQYVSVQLNTEENMTINQQSKPVNGLPSWGKSEIPYSSSSANQSYFKPISDEKKYSYLQSGKEGSRVSTGIPFEQSNELRTDFRTSEPIVETRGKDMSREPTLTAYQSTYGQTTGCTEVKKYTSAISPLQVNFNAQPCKSQQYNEGYQMKSKKKEQQPISHLYKGDETSNKTRTPSVSERDKLKSNLQESKPTPSHLDFNYSQSKATTDSYCSQKSNLFKNSLGLGGDVYSKSVTKDMLGKKDSDNKGLNIERERQMLKSVSKQPNQIQEREHSKNSYLHKVMEQRGIKLAEEDRDREIRDKEQLNLKSSLMQKDKDIEQKSRELSDKNKQIWDKSKTIIEKNKSIESLANQVRQFKHLLDIKQKVWIRKERELEDQKSTLQREVKQTKDKLLRVQKSAQEILSELTNDSEQKNRQIEERNIQVQRLGNSIDALNQRILQIALEKNKYSSKNEELREAQSKSDIEIFQLKSSLIAKEKQIMLLENQVQQLRVKCNEKQVPVAELSCKHQNVLGVKQISKIDILQREMVAFSDKIQASPKLETEQYLKHRLLLLQENQKEIVKLLFDENEYEHEKMMNKLKQMKENERVTEDLILKEQQRAEEHQLLRLHQDYFQKKYHEMNRELKRAGNKIMGVNNEVQQGWRLLSEANHQIVLLNLINLNRKYQPYTQEEQ